MDTSEVRFFIAATMNTTIIQEFCDSRGVSLRVDRESGVIEGVKILGLESRNGRTYLSAAAKAAIGLYEGAAVNVNHPRGSATSPRDYQDRIGRIRNVRADAGGLRADFQFNPKHPLAEQLIWDAEHSPENVGFSHNVEARCNRRGGREVVEEIIKVQSVDLVADPATTRGLFEEFNNQNRKVHDVEIITLTEAELRTSRPDLCKAIADSALTEQANSETAKAAAMELKTVKEELAAAKAQIAAGQLLAAIDKELTEAKLPAAMAELVKPMLLETADATARKAIIENARKTSAALGGGKPLSRERQVTEGDASVKDGKGMAAAILE